MISWLGKALWLDKDNLFRSIIYFLFLTVRLFKIQKISVFLFNLLWGLVRLFPAGNRAFTSRKVGGVRIIITPPQLAYGTQQAGPIPQIFTLVYPKVEFGGFGP